MTKGSLYEKLKKKKGGGECEKGSNRMLITVNVAGSAGALRFVAREDEMAREVIRTALKLYAREGRLPLLGSDATNFLLYCANAQADVLSPRERIGSKDVRSFVLHKKQETATPLILPHSKSMIEDKGSHVSWKAWFNKSLSFKILSH